MPLLLLLLLLPSITKLQPLRNTAMYIEIILLPDSNSAVHRRGEYAPVAQLAHMQHLSSVVAQYSETPTT